MKLTQETKYPREKKSMTERKIDRDFPTPCYFGVSFFKIHKCGNFYTSYNLD
jgi:hypothetical protein